ncbi:DnaJ-domain-containing protein [Macrolepiota fuliginosa MF-IS2]|uniref:DnaJ-domain-containing protein n=1 Tax=Macrolepiota fuliginosa MF-IS2 TaxID=1400762 RepID=A0A9P5XK68_9AGAR|nr:DnaJ-domain-containing protein [Macrolepiota fuliginosa MF-IS2]
MPPRSYYRILGIPSAATADEIKQAYKTMALRWHPDRHPDDVENATRRFLEVQDAYQALMREDRQYLDSTSIPSPVTQCTESVSTYQTYQTGTCFSASTSTLGSFIRVSASSMDSVVTPATTFKSGTSSHKSYPSEPQWGGRNGPTVASHPPQYANDDHSRRTYSKPPAPPFGRPRARHSSENLRQYSEEWSNYTPPSLPKYSTTRQSKDSRTFTIVPPARKQHAPPATTTSWDYYRLHQRHQTLPLRSLGIGPAREWVYSLALTLRELLNGKQCSFSLSRNLISGGTKDVILEVDIPPGCRGGTRILCRGVGHERKDKTRQDIVFIVEELNHDHFSWVHDDLILEVKIPWDGSLRHQGGDFVVEGLDGKGHCFRVDYPWGRMLKGKSVIRGAGMPIRRGGRVVGRGSLIVHWEIIPQHPKVLNFMKRFMHFRR